jgi:hypothetical protein
VLLADNATTNLQPESNAETKKGLLHRLLKDDEYRGSRHHLLLKKNKSTQHRINRNY